MAIDTRTHVMGDMLMITGTFNGTEGGFSYDGLLGTVFAAGGHLEDTYYKTSTRSNGTGTAGDTSITVDGTDARLNFTQGMDIYDGSGNFYGVVKDCPDALTIRLQGTLKRDLADNENLFLFGPRGGSVTLQSGTFLVGIDTKLKKVTFVHGSIGATETDHLSKGRFWILGNRA